MKALRGYPKVWNMGGSMIRELFDGPVVVQEKIDGSQFSFGVVDGGLHFRSKGAEIYGNTTDKLFRQAVETVFELFAADKLVEGWTYRGEAMRGPKHNALEYERQPVGGLILFDVDTAQESRVGDPRELAGIAESLGLECVPVLYEGLVHSANELRDLLARPSCLGGMMEGVVVKNYGRWGNDGKMLMGKVVQESFREINAGNWKKENPSRQDLIGGIIQQYCTTPRWEKAVQHLRETGKLEGDPRDIGLLIKEVGDDVRTECEAEIKEALFKYYWGDIRRGITRGLPEWYKGTLTEQQFAESEVAA